MLKNLKSLFIVEEDQEETKKPTTPKDKEGNEASTPNVSEPAPPTRTSAASTTGIVDPKIVEKLLGAIEKNNLEGFDYLEYKKALKALEKMPMDESTKYRSAFATASTMGVTLDKLLETTKFYIGVLDKESEQFTNAFKNQFDDKVSGREREIAQFESIIKEKSAQIKALTEEIAKHQTQIEGLKAKVQESNAKINKTQNDFKQSYDLLKSQFEEDMLKMQKYLK
ncbi:hypothetical protein POV27_12425 [Aureisphaera galaxeae]|uniref:hypothetical protein n=1 Tax=Aureisphaera galaxeae TaxID=1538023 RepID=UPI00234FC206|nr:hypothetical protein [Aureisphaera galaxeae]MDC8004859.1 hypothetical protein [Aureisphaera galaxeae]